MIPRKCSFIEDSRKDQTQVRVRVMLWKIFCVLVIVM